MEKKQNKYSIRKFSIGASSILIGALLFLGAGTAQAAEEEGQQQVDATPSKQEVNTNTSLSDESNQNNTQAINQENSKDATTESSSQKDVHNAQDVATESDLTTNDVNPKYNEQDKADTATKDQQTEGTSKEDQTKSTESPVDPEYNEQDKADTATKDQQAEGTTKEDQTKSTESLVDPEYNEQDKADTATKDQQAEGTTKDTQEQTSTNQQSKVERPQNVIQDNKLTQTNNANVANEDIVATQDNTAVEADNQQVVSEKVDSDQQNDTVSLEQLQSELQSTDSPQDNSKDEDSTSTLKALKDSAVATVPKQTQQTSEQTNEQPTKTAKQGQYKNDDPIILVHGFNGFTDDINPPILSHYWGGDKLNIRQDLQDNGYETYEASIGALSSNYDRAVELYYYIKGGTVDYGAAHAEKYGHERYGKTYEGVYKDWQPGQKVHLVAYSMGGQTVRQLEELLRNGNPEEIAYQKEHGGEISPLYQGGNDNMITSITTLGTPHNGTVASDELGNEAFIRQVVYDYVKFKGNTDSHSDFGLNQWGLKQKEGESYLDYVKRVQNSKLWKTQDNGLYDLSTEGAAKLNANTSLNPNIVYKTYTGESTRPTLFGRQKSDLNMFLPFTLTGNIIGKTANTSWRENDGLVSVVSSQHPNNQAYVDATDEIQKGVWQVTPVRHGWDHVDFVGQDATDPTHDSVELQQFWHGIADELVRSEQLDA
ncbi:lipase [Staphylococcus gallinarum]|jgi:triacylglycerol lipase|uniref:YSIRK-targeted triacylglycerol lipase n=1 Tax=Staphylococcus gallinarum TaxID=1293 RepID=UPI000D1E50F2|nr:YSIRK-type signal peptide-containing protein [Staphylococcus gallinarum]MCD8820836.1 YSIRK-type signal peptide-containing protein [Staphylococcus gallinarum]PTL08071.1 lipase [Staphylococcus gallinarum]PTL09575.1 lipase [Staphylococcus gallinarum]RIL35433.1 YSIRK-type signal peptide-containing protein [Staphylococcus gallinarum]RIO78123.1 YSIRK-type signal peptide-containing protein [Staphylococcus gallinarum]